MNGLLESLPPALAERTRRVGRRHAASSGEWVLYWMRTAVRTQENPALNVAIEFSNQLGLPLLVYHGLSERYPYASDRHHTFILQGARDVQAEFANTPHVYALHVERAGHRGPHLKTLAQRAAVVVTEDMPTEPLRSWTVGLSRVLPCDLFAVDTACVVPMSLVGRSHQRAFEFRDATSRLYTERVSLGPHDSELKTRSVSAIDLPFEPVDLQESDIAGIVSQCEIDHSIGPVPHSIGGSIAGYERWQNFKDAGLSAYHRRRNDALVDGVSRLSPYLHYGMVAPMRIAREAAANKSKGAEKFLDELLIWRELAYAFCQYRRDHGRLSAIPRWAIQTLAEHESDSRVVLSWETMSRGRTGDSLWDSAQQSLLVHGELHNNVRMTWGKAILQWTSDAKQALARMIELNHRYALDGRDPSSYGGILWCLGQFDRPFAPPTPVYGTVRNRSTEQHAGRLDPIAYRCKVRKPLWDPIPRIAIIGAGMSGLICARTLRDHGCDVTVFEKSRGVAGRMATRRVDDSLQFDHGAQFFTARDQRFKRYVQSWREVGVVAPWKNRVVVIENGVITAEKIGDTRYVAVPGMSSIGKHLAADLNVRLETQVAAPKLSASGWLLASDDGVELGQFDGVVVAVPSHQAVQLLSEAPELREQANLIKMDACWALMLAFDQPLGVGFDGAFVRHSPLSWIARNSSKAGRMPGRETWVAHAAAEWSLTHIDVSPDQIQQVLLDAFLAAARLASVEPVHLDVHRWRFASVSKPFTDRCLFDVKRRIGACGDWHGGSRVENVFLSGMAMAGRMLGQINTTSPTSQNEQKQLELF